MKQEMKTIEQKIYGILEELSHVPVTDPDMRLSEDLVLDSLRMVTLLVRLEEDFSFELNEKDMNPFALLLVKDVIHLVERYWNAKGGKK